MKNKLNNNVETKQKYTQPKLSKLGTVSKITLKAGSRSDAFGGSYTP